MKGHDDVLEHLNDVLLNELTIINQSFLHARMLGNWGIKRLENKIYKRSIKSMKDADEVIERVLFLEGLPAMQELGKLWIGQHVEEILDCEMKLELSALNTLRDAIGACETLNDYVSRDELTEILEGHEDYIDWIEAQQYQVEKMGVQNYIQLMAGEDD